MLTLEHMKKMGENLLSPSSQLLDLTFFLLGSLPRKFMRLLLDKQRLRGWSSGKIFAIQPQDSRLNPLLR